MVRRVLYTLVLVVIVSGAAVAWVWWHAQPKPIGDAYAGVGDIALWDGTGPVRRQLEALSYGERLVVLDRYSDSAEVRTPRGRIGWVDDGDLIEPDIWQRLGDLAVKVRAMPVQALGHTSVLSNVRIDPGLLAPRVGQLRANTPVQILARAVIDRGGTDSAAGSAGSRNQDWFLIRARTPQVGEIAGWVFGEFIAEDPPLALAPDITSAGMRPVAWFALRKVNDPTQGSVPYYLMLGTDQSEGSTCDFDMLRVYTWSTLRHQYETAFVQNGLCGRLPVQLTFESDRQRSVLFGFQNVQSGGSSTLTYRMEDTLVFPLRPPAPSRRTPR